MTTTTITAAVFTDEVLARAAELARDSYRPVWTGASGEESTGEAVARHLEAASALLEADGWTRTYPSATPVRTVLPAIETMSTEAMVREVLIAVRDEITATAGASRTLSAALEHVAHGEDGDGDTRYVASEILTLLIRALTGHDQAAATPWAERLHRTHQDVTALLTAGACYARTYGPAGQAQHAA
ncbi:hypothetical protein ACIOMM_30795 [Streptomyces sp. NPDC087908]|uniref:DUF6197 family protein n=1 Tax=Streptomyces sp. NPDC087908 TaxID=3365820 RepID=UPI00381D9C69